MLLRRVRRRLDRLRRMTAERGDRPSFQSEIRRRRRIDDLARELGAPPRSIISRGKFEVYRVAESVGLEIPEQYGMWDTIDSVDWDALPDRVVLKSRSGASSRGVLPLRRVGGGWQLISHEGVVGVERLVAQQLELQAAGKVSPPYGAEEFLDDGSGGIPVDVKAYAFYGEVPLVMLRRVPRHAAPETEIEFRFVDPSGRDVLDVYHDRPTRKDIPIPDALDECVEGARRMSLAIEDSFSRIDLYALPGRVVFGEVTPRPGGEQWLGAELDERLGAALERAEMRLARDQAARRDDG